MPVRYGQDTKAKAIRLVRGHAGDYPSEYAAITAVARRLAMTPERLAKLRHTKQGVHETLDAPTAKKTTPKGAASMILDASARRPRPKPTGLRQQPEPIVSY